MWHEQAPAFWLVAISVEKNLLRHDIKLRAKGHFFNDTSSTFVPHCSKIQIQTVCDRRVNLNFMGLADG